MHLSFSPTSDTAQLIDFLANITDLMTVSTERHFLEAHDNNGIGIKTYAHIDDRRKQRQQRMKAWTEITVFHNRDNIR